MFKKAVSVSEAEGHSLEQWALKRSLTAIKRFFKIGQNLDAFNNIQKKIRNIAHR
jgi:hypothetical protein